MIILYGDPGKGLSQLDDNARNPAIADDHVRAEPESHHRQSAIEPIEEELEIGEIRGLEQPVGCSARLEPYELGQRRIGGQLAAQASSVDRRGHRAHAVLARAMPSASPAAH